MDVLILTLFVSLMLAGAGVGLFVWSIRSGAQEHADRLALLPLDGERSSAPERQGPRARNERSEEK